MDEANKTQPETQLLTPDQLAALTPSRRKARTVSPQTIRRWQSHGLRGVFLTYVRVGVVPCSNLMHLNEFFEKLTELDHQERYVPSRNSSGRSATYKTPEKISREAERLGL